MIYLLKHRGYYGKIYYSKEDKAYVGKVLGIRSMISVHENTVNETIEELIEAIDDYLIFCKEDNLLPNETDCLVARELESYFINATYSGSEIAKEDFKDLVLV